MKSAINKCGECIEIILNKKLGCYRKSMQCSISLNILLSQSRSLKFIQIYTADWSMCKFLFVLC